VPWCRWPAVPSGRCAAWALGRLGAAPLHRRAAAARRAAGQRGRRETLVESFGWIALRLSIPDDLDVRSDTART